MALPLPEVPEGMESVPPDFARTAAQLLREGKAEEARVLCEAGTMRFPSYPTGNLILGKCHEALGKDLEALAEYRKALKLVPDNPALRGLVAAMEQREEDAFSAFAAQRSQSLPQSTRTIDEYVSGVPPAKETTVDFLLKQLQSASKIVPPVAPRPAEDRAPAAGPEKFVTPTLAEIYAEQKEYAEAIAAYRRLIEQRPEDAGRFAARLEELEELARRAAAGQRPPQRPEDEE